MISCVDTTELGHFLDGRLDPERMTEVDTHLRECPRCRALARGRMEFKRTAAMLGSSLLNVADCPDYDELSAFVDESVARDRAEMLRAHVNSCELCFADVERMRELRSQAALRGSVSVRPGAASAGGSVATGWWRRVLAGSAIAGLATTAVLWTLGPGVRQANEPITALKQPARTSPAAKTPYATRDKTPGAKPETPTVAQNPVKPATPVAGATATRPAASRAVLRDGGYRVVDRDGNLFLAKVDGTSIKTALEARLMALIEEKVRTGKVKLADPVRVAMNTLTRDGAGYAAPPTAPKLEWPRGEVLLSDKPTLKWSKVDLAESYRVLVTTMDGGVVLEQVTQGTAFTLARPLSRGREYRWQVGVRFSEGDNWTNSQAAGFAVLSADAAMMIRDVESQAPGSHLALGAAYESVGLYDEAAAEYRALLRDNPRSSLAKKMLLAVSGGAQ